MDTTSVEAVTQETTEEINAFLQLIQNNTGALVGLGLKVVFAIIFFLIGRYLIKWVRKVVKAAFERSSADPGVATFVDSLLKFGL